MSRFLLRFRSCAPGLFEGAQSDELCVEWEGFHMICIECRSGKLSVVSALKVRNLWRKTILRQLHKPGEVVDVK